MVSYRVFEKEADVIDQTFAVKEVVRRDKHIPGQ